MKRLLCLRLPEWPLQRLLAARPELDGRAVVLHARRGSQGEFVHACSPAALARGARVGMPLREALALEQGPPAQRPITQHPIIPCPRDPAGDAAALVELAQRCVAFSPLVGWAPEDAAALALSGALAPRDHSLPARAPAESRRPGEPDYILLDVAGVAALFGGERALARQALRLCHSLGYRARAALADTGAAAWALARWSANAPDHAAEAADDLLAAPPGELERALAPLPPAALRLSDRVVDLLARLGVETIGQLCRLPRDGLATRFGAELPFRLDQAFGRAGEPLVSCQPPRRFVAEWRLEHPTQRWETLAEIARRLLDRLAAELARRQVGALRVDCRLAGAFTPAWERHVGLYQPAGSAEYLWDLLRVPLERFPPPGEVDHVALAIPWTAPLRARQLYLFGDPAPAAHNAARAELIDRLSCRLGADAVTRVEATGDAAPERAARHVPLAAPAAEAQRRPAGKASVAGEAFAAGNAPPRALVDRPLWLLPRPEPLRDVRLTARGTPAAFVWRGRTHLVARCVGPERIETGWWRGASARRDYHRVETTAGLGYWLFRELPGGAWKMHGLF